MAESRCAGSLDCSRALSAGAPVVLFALSLANLAHPSEVLVTSDTVAQGYALSTPRAVNAITRRRITHTMRLAATDLQQASLPPGAQLSVVADLQVDYDFGENRVLSGVGRETGYGNGLGAGYLPGYDPYAVSVREAYVSISGLAGGSIDGSIGRRIVVDPLGWWAFDGGEINVRAARVLTLGGYGGWEERGGLPLSTSRYERPGVWRGSYEDFIPGGPTAREYPSYLPAGPAPAWGVHARGNLPWGTTLQAAYRWVASTSDTTHNPWRGELQDDGSRTSSERVAASLSTQPLGSLQFDTSAIYDVLAYRVSSARAALVYVPIEPILLGVDIDYFVPSFDGDSIFSAFDLMPSSTLMGRVGWVVSPATSMDVAAGVRRWQTAGDPSDFGVYECAEARRLWPGRLVECGAGATFDASDSRLKSPGGNARNVHATYDVITTFGAHHRFLSGTLGMAGQWMQGNPADLRMLSVDGSKSLDADRFQLSGAVTGMSSRMGGAAPIRSAGYLLGLARQATGSARLGVSWEQDFLNVGRTEYRVLASAQVRIVP